MMKNKSIVDLFNECFELNPHLQEKFIDGLRQHCPAQAAELEKLLAAEPTVIGLAKQAEDVQNLPASIPTQVAEYRITDILGIGGMGMVLLGHRDDIDLSVAIKVAHNSHQNELTKLALEQEAKVLANLEHPNIASIKDWGYLDNFGHYIATEFVDGENIQKFCKKNHPTATAIIKLFIKVVQAVSHAHSRLVLHRDIKPNNIMVTTAGEPKLIDFGVAKVLSSIHASEEQTISAGLTPSYASPEQLRGEPLSIKSDVYSLGVVLLQLLVKQQQPQNYNNLSLKQTEQLLMTARSNEEQEWHGIGKQTLADLALVIHTAMAEDLNQRYANGEDLSSDLNAVLAVRPIKAREPSSWYKLKRFTLRHRLGVLVSALALILIMVTTSFAVWQWNEAIKQRNEAVETNVELVNYTRFLRQVLRGINTNSGGSANTSVEDFLKQAVMALQEEQDVSHYQLAWFSHLLAGIYQGRGNYTAALDLYEIGLEYTKLSPEPLDDVGLLIAKAILHGSDLQFDKGYESATQAIDLINQFPETEWKRPLAKLALAFSYQESGQLAQSISVFDEVINDPKNHVAHVANALLNKANSQNRLFQMDEAVKNIDKALITFLDRYGEESAYVAQSQSLLYLMQNKKDKRDFNLKTQNDLIQLHNTVYKSNDPEQALLFIKLAETHFLRNDLGQAIDYLNHSSYILKHIQSTVSIHTYLAHIQMAKYQMLDNDLNGAVNTLNKIDTSLFNKLAKHEVAKFYQTETWINIINNDIVAAKQSFEEAKRYLENTEYVDIMAESDFINAQLSALEKNYQACYKHAQKATDQAENLYPKTWQLPNAYRYLLDVCQLKLDAQQGGPLINNVKFPYLPALLDSPWRMKAEFTNEILNNP